MADMTHRQKARLMKSEERLAKALFKAAEEMAKHLDVCSDIGLGPSRQDDSRVRLMGDCREYASWLDRRRAY